MNNRSSLLHRWLLVHATARVGHLGRETHGLRDERMTRRFRRVGKRRLHGRRETGDGPTLSSSLSTVDEALTRSQTNNPAVSLNASGFDPNRAFIDVFYRRVDVFQLAFVYSDDRSNVDEFHSTVLRGLISRVHLSFEIRELARFHVWSF